LPLTYLAYNIKMIWLIIISSLILANLPWITNSFFFIFKPIKKSFILIFSELVLFYFLIGGFFMFIEKEDIGNIHKQEWEFYVITFCLFIVFSFPGFIYKVIWKK